MSLQRESRITDPSSTNQGSASPQGDGAETPAVRQALEDLRLAVESRQVEKICSDYAALRKKLAGTKLGDMFEIIAEVLGPHAKAILISAHSHRHCFMCDAGMLPCDQCEGTGVSPSGKPCSHCDGFGLAECTFCRGTGWADPETIPAEMRQAVHDRQFRQVQDELNRVKQETGLLASKFAMLDAAHRRRIGGWLMRLSARLADLEQQAKQANDVSNQTAFGAAVGEVDSLLHNLAHPGASRKSK